MPITKEQAQSLLNKGYSEQEVIQFMRKAMQTGDLGQAAQKQDRSKFETPEFQGGALSPANIQAQKDVEEARSKTGTIPALGEAIGKTASAYINPALGNIPEILAQKAGTTTMAGLTEQEKMMGAGAAMLSPFGLGNLTFKGVMGLAPKATGLAKVGLAGLAGAGAAATQLPTPEEAPTLASAQSQQMAKAIGGFVLGAGFEQTGQAIGSISKYYQIEKQLKGFAEKLGVPVEDAIGKLNKNIKETESTIKSSWDDFKKVLSEQTQGITKEIKPKLINFSKRLSKAYGDRIDDMDTLISGSESQMTKQDVAVNLVESALNKVAGDPNAVNKIKGIAEANGYRVESLMDSEGSPFFSVNHEVPDAEISLKDLLKLKNTFKEKALSASIKSGAGQKATDTAYQAVQDSWGHMLADYFPDEVGASFVKLNKEYAPLAQAKWEAMKVFKPHDPGEIRLDKGAAFLQKALESGFQSDQARILNILEKSNNLTPGIGNISSRLRQIKDPYIKTERDLTKKIEDMLEQKDKIESLQKSKKESVESMYKTLGALGLATTAGSKYGKKAIHFAMGNK